MLITAAEVSVQTGQTYTGDALTRVESFIQNVSDSIEAYCRRTFTDPVPGAIKAVALIEVRRMLNVDPGIDDERIGDLGTGFVGTNEILSASSLAALDAYLRWTTPRASSLRLVSPLRGPALPEPYFEVSDLVHWPDNIIILGRTLEEGLVQFQTSPDGWTWADHVFVESLDISDGGYPAWRVIYPAPSVSGHYKWRARWRYDDDTSPWTRALYTNYQV
ncbi:hypothetical protein E1264_03555 [Actinomadura sp. KC216]|uniref:hypothetical protein n=1 Tax=Actinomadura sp. KC216 TaxID=2530370 RepID=UPI001053A84E|nr:hypothetical protein [Actinomadura sp. KC216]TDB90914.1 hypothetical protein E1264_03555 [Actinomadura sp. KC216]